jgi:hypothetical protein
MWANYYQYGKMDAEQIFNHLKTQVHYKEDPKNIELLQSMPSLFLDNYWGKPGTGDCDCFTITACSVLLVCGFKTGYTIYGNSRQPSHIAADIFVKKYGRVHSIPFDLCAPHIDTVKNYLWSQEHKLTLDAITATR